MKSRFETLEANKAKLLTGIASLDPATLNRKPDAVTWSILQVVAHLTKSETGILQYIKKKAQDPSALPKSGLMPWLRLGVLYVGIRSPFKFKAPRGTGDVPESGEFQAMSLAWAEVREDWRDFVEAFPQALRDRVIFRHPFVGMLGPTQVLMFMNEHLLNHSRQIHRIRKALGA